MIEIESGEVIHLFRLMRRHQDELSAALLPLYSRLERRLYESLSIKEMEELSEGDDSAADNLRGRL